MTSTATIQSLTESNSNFNNDEVEFLAKLKVWKDLLIEHNSTCDNLKASCQTQVIDPMKKLNSLFPQVYEAIKRRQHAFNELCKQQSIKSQSNLIHKNYNFNSIIKIKVN